MTHKQRPIPDTFRPTDEQLHLAFDLHDFEQDIFNIRRELTELETSLLRAKDLYSKAVVTHLRATYNDQHFTPAVLEFSPDRCKSKMITHCVRSAATKAETPSCIFCGSAAALQPTG